MTERTLWPHQSRGLASLWAMIDAGRKRICLTMPTGGGKTITSVHLIKNECRSRGWKVEFTTHRKLLLRQTSGVFAENGVEHGIRASGYPTDLDATVQLSSTKTEFARTLKGRWGVHAARVLIIDEIHVNKCGGMMKLLDMHQAADPNLIVIGLTATPVGIWHICKDIVVAGTNSELRATTPPSHVIAIEYAPDEPDLAGLKQNAEGEFIGDEEEKRNPPPVVFGSVFEHWKKHNPKQLPSVLFAPSVAASRWFVDLFMAQGVKTAHIDGESLYFGEKDAEGNSVIHYTAKPEDRDEVFERFKDGTYKILTNRFVLTEGIDIPSVYMGIFATSFGSPVTWLQAGGRIVRAHYTLDHVIIADHGANLSRHGSLNLDRDWQVGDTWEMHTAGGEKSPVGKPKCCRRCKAEGPPVNGKCSACGLEWRDAGDPIVCEKCGAFRTGGPTCHECGHKSTRSGRMVRQVDGTLKLYVEPVKKKPVEQKAKVIRDFESALYGSRNSKSPAASTFSQLVSSFRISNPEYVIHKNYDNNGNVRWAALQGGKLHFLPLPPATDAYKMALRVRDIPNADFYAIMKQDATKKSEKP